MKCETWNTRWKAMKCNTWNAKYEMRNMKCETWNATHEMQDMECEMQHKSQQSCLPYIYGRQTDRQFASVWSGLVWMDEVSVLNRYVPQCKHSTKCCGQCHCWAGPHDPERNDQSLRQRQSSEYFRHTCMHFFCGMAYVTFDGIHSSPFRIWQFGIWHGYWYST